MISQPSAKMAGSQLLYEICECLLSFPLHFMRVEPEQPECKLFHVSLMTAFDVISTVYQLYRGPQSLLITLRPSLQASSHQGRLEHFGFICLVLLTVCLSVKWTTWVRKGVGCTVLKTMSGGGRRSWYSCARLDFFFF